MRLAERLVLGRVGVDERRHVVGMGLPADDQLGLAHQLADAAPDQVHAHDRAVGDAHELHEARRTQDLALAVAGEVVDQRLDGVAVLLAGLRLGETDGGDLGLGVGDARDGALGHRHGLEPGELLGQEDAVLEAAVGQLQPGDEVADGVHARHRGLQRGVDRHEAALGGHALLLQAEPVGDRAAADGHEQQVGVVGRAALDGDADAGLRGLDGLDPGAGVEADAALAEGALEGLGAVLVLGRHEVGQRLEHGDLGPEGAPHAGELDADDAATQHDHRAGDLGQAQRVLGGEHPLAVDLDAGEGARLRPRGEHDGAGGRPGLAIDLDGARTAQPPGALDDGDAATLHQPGEAPVEARDDAVGVGVDGLHVDALERRAHAEALAVTGGVGDLGRVQQGLGGDAADVKAGAADLVLLDEGHGEPELGGAQRTGVATRACAEHHDVELPPAGCGRGTVGHD